MSTFDHEESQIRYQTAVEVSEHSLFALLKPSLKRNGDQWCVLYGDDLQTGVAGFGKSPAKAVLAFTAAWYTMIESTGD